MTSFFLHSLPFLTIYVFGLILALKRKDTRPGLALWGAVCYGVLIVYSVMGLIQVGCVIMAHQRGAEIGAWSGVLKVLGIFRSVVFYLVYSALAVGALRWRQDGGGVSRSTAVPLGVSIFLMAADMALTHGGARPASVGPLIFILGLGSMITLLIAFYGGRGDGAFSTFAALFATPAPPTPANPGELAPGATPAAPPKGMFEERDYIPFVLGVLILGGLVLVPLLWGQINRLNYAWSIFPSLLSCGIFLYAHDRRGNFSVAKFLAGYLIVFMAILRAVARPGSGGGKPFFIAGGFLGFVVLFACGWAGIGVARLLRPKVTENK